MMKNIIYICLIMFAGHMSAQVKPKNISEESVVKTTTTDNGSEVVEQKIKLTTRSEQAIEFAEEDKDKTDKAVIESPVKFNQTLEINGHADTTYNSKTEIDYYEFNGNRYGFKKVDNGFSVSSDNKEIPTGNLVKFNRENHYIYQNGSETGIGYFTNDGSFIIEYYDVKTGKIKTQNFIMQQQ